MVSDALQKRRGSQRFCEASLSSELESWRLSLQAELLSRRAARKRWLDGVLADRSFHGVLLVWALCCGAVFLCVAKFGVSLPWCDEWTWTSIATGRQPLSWAWLWEANNEHRQPLMRLGLFVLGRLSHWNWQAMHYATSALLGIGALALLFAARSIRGRSALSDTFLCLVVLTPWQWETVWRYGYAIGGTGGLTCIALSLAAVRWPQRSRTHLASYYLIVLAVTLTGGPPGNFMALGLVGALASCFWETTSRAWKIWAAAGAGLIGAVSVFLLLSIPTIPHHTGFVSNSLKTTLIATAKESVCWLGAPVLEVLWPWAFLVLLLPSLWIGGRILCDLFRWRQQGQSLAREWIDLGTIGLASLLVAAAIAYGRARLDVWSSRYVMLALPIGLVLYLLLVRMRAPLAIPHTLAIVMALCCGWCWPSMMVQEKVHRERVAELVGMFAQGDVPLSFLCGQYHADLGWGVERVPLLTSWMIQLRQSDQSIFHAINGRKRRAGAALPQAWKADAGELSDGWEVVSDSNATEDRTLRVNAAGQQPALAVYHVHMATGGIFRVCCRMRSPKEHTLTVRVDGKELQKQTFPATPEFRPCLLTSTLILEPGQLELALTLSPASSALDLVELLPLVTASGR